MPDVIQLAWGRIEYGPNEVSIVSTVEDPPGVRLAATAGGGLGKLSFNRMRADGQQEELVLLQGKIDERFRSPSDGGTSGGETVLVGELRLDLRRPPQPGDANDDAQMIPICQMRYDGITFHVPVGVASNAGGPVSQFYSDDGRYLYNVQGDPTPEYPHGRIVQYRRSDMVAVAILKPEPLP